MQPASGEFWVGETRRDSAPGNGRKSQETWRRRSRVGQTPMRHRQPVGRIGDEGHALKKATARRPPRNGLGRAVKATNRRSTTQRRVTQTRLAKALHQGRQNVLIAPMPQ